MKRRTLLIELFCLECWILNRKFLNTEPRTLLPYRTTSCLEMICLLNWFNFPAFLVTRSWYMTFVLDTRLFNSDYWTGPRSEKANRSSGSRISTQHSSLLIWIAHILQVWCVSISKLEIHHLRELKLWLPNHSSYSQKGLYLVTPDFNDW